MKEMPSFGPNVQKQFVLVFPAHNMTRRLFAQKYSALEISNTFIVSRILQQESKACIICAFMR